MDKSKKHYDRIKAKKERDKRNYQDALSHYFDNPIMDIISGKSNKGVR